MRLIDADALIKNFVKKRRPLTGADGSKDRYRYMQFLGDVEEIEHAPIIDAVPIIRCKDCKHFIVEDNIRKFGLCKWCESLWLRHGYEWFCPNGERKQDE